jgi:hypothetical protein
VRAAFETYAAHERRPRWGDKTPGYVRHLDLLAAAFPDATFIHLVRDGREVADSLVDRPWGPDSLLVACHLWRRDVAAGAEAGARLGDRYLEARYERLVGDPAAELARICRFLGEEPVPEMLDHRDRAREAHGGEPQDHRHLGEAVTANLRNWQDRWSPRERRLIEGVLGPTLDRFGYALSNGGPSLADRSRGEAVLLARRVRGRVRPRRART